MVMTERTEAGIVALLPMKAHSERVKGKNFRRFASRPLFQWTLSTLLSMDEIGHVVINTDARDLLLGNGLEEMPGCGKVIIRDRRPELCGDFVSMNRIIADDIAAIGAQAYAMTHTTNPLLGAPTIRNALAAYQAGLAKGHDSLFTVNRVQARFYRADGSAVNHDPDTLLRTQDLEPWFEENSNLYVFSRASFAATNARIGRTPLLFEMPAGEAVDIDGPEEWSIAEAIAEYRMRRRDPGDARPAGDGT